MIQGLVKVVLSRIKNPSKSPFTKGRLSNPPLKKGGKGGFSENEQFTQVTLALTWPRQ